MTPLLPLLAKALSTAAVVVLASVMAEAFGPFWGALVTSLPIATGPAYVFLALDHSDSFIATAALNSFVSISALLVFLITYALIGQRLRPLLSLGSALLTWMVASLILRMINWTVPLALLMDTVAFFAAFRIARRVQVVLPFPRKPMARRWYDLPLRGAIVGSFVLLVVSVADLLGPQATGIASVFPITLTSLLLLLRPRVGAAEAVMVTLITVRGMIGLSGFLMTLHLTAIPLGAPWALVAGLGTSFAWSGVMMARRKR